MTSEALAEKSRGLSPPQMTQNAAAEATSATKKDDNNGDNSNKQDQQGRDRRRLRVGNIPAHLLAGNRVERNASDRATHDPHLPRPIAQLPQKLRREHGKRTKQEGKTASHYKNDKRLLGKRPTPASCAGRDEKEKPSEFRPANRKMLHESTDSI